MKKTASLIFCLVIVTVLFLAGCGDDSGSVDTIGDTLSHDTPFSQEIFAMDTYMTITAYGPQGAAAVQSAAAEIDRLDALFSISSAEGEISSLNESQGKPIVVSEETRWLLARAIAIGEETGGAFDCTVLPIMQAWGFPTQAYQVPTTAALAQLVSEIGMQHITIAEDSVTIDYFQNSFVP